jgi:hypothetical protein
MQEQRKENRAKSIIAKCKIAKYLLKGNGKIFQQVSEKGCEGEDPTLIPSHPNVYPDSKW